MVRRRVTRRSAAVAAADAISKQDQPSPPPSPSPSSAPAAPEIDLSTLECRHTSEAEHLGGVCSPSLHPDQHGEMQEGNGEGEREGEEVVGGLVHEGERGEGAAPALDMDSLRAAAAGQAEADFTGGTGALGMSEAAQEAFWASLPGGGGVDMSVQHSHATLEELSRALELNASHLLDHSQLELDPALSHPLDHLHLPQQTHHHNDNELLDPSYPTYDDHHDEQERRRQQAEADEETRLHQEQQAREQRRRDMFKPMFSGGFATTRAFEDGNGGGEGSAEAEPEGEYTKNRKENHKEVERRRRETINTGISRLAAIVPTNEKNKAAILERAAQYIELLRKTETSNIEKWTMEKTLMDQSLEDMKRELEEERELRVRAEKRCRVLIEEKQRSGGGMGTEVGGEQEFFDGVALLSGLAEGLNANGIGEGSGGMYYESEGERLLGLKRQRIS